MDVGTTMYTYCVGDPINRVDPYGLDSWVYYDAYGIAGQKPYVFFDDAKYMKNSCMRNMGQRCT